jgi:hypothetical protein
MGSKSLLNRPLSSATNGNVFTAYSPFSDAMLTKTVNDFEDDLLTGRMNGRGTGFTGGYTSSIANTTPTAVIPSYSGWSGTIPLPDPTLGTGASAIKVASSSTQDSPTGTGAYLYILFYLDLTLTPKTEVFALNGTTPVTLACKDVYHFQYAFPILPGSGYNVTGGIITSNVGQIWLGIGTTFSTTTGFNTVNYMWNRIGDGFMSSTIYVVPKNKMASLWNVKLSSDTTVSCLFKTYSRSGRTACWSLNAEDNVNTGIVIRRTLAGGFLPAGAEFTVIANKTASAANIACNFVMSCYEFSSRIYNQGNPDI